jgi:hypothetical protein
MPYDTDEHTSLLMSNIARKKGFIVQATDLYLYDALILSYLKTTALF